MVLNTVGEGQAIQWPMCREKVGVAAHRSPSRIDAPAIGRRREGDSLVFTGSGGFLMEFEAFYGGSPDHALSKGRELGNSISRAKGTRFVLGRGGARWCVRGIVRRPNISRPNLTGVAVIFHRSAPPRAMALAIALRLAASGHVCTVTRRAPAMVGLRRMPAPGAFLSLSLSRC